MCYSIFKIILCDPMSDNLAHFECVLFKDVYLRNAMDCLKET